MSSGITVVIPTRERADVLRHSLRTVAEQQYSRLQILVCDNFSQDNTAEVVQSFQDSRIRYVNPGKRLSMSHNWEFAIGNVQTEWVTVLGDDDGFLPNAIQEIMSIVESTKVDAIRTALCNYQWPGVGGIESGILSVPKGKRIEVRSASQWLRKTIQLTGDFNSLPVIYTGGFVKTELLKRVRSELGCVFGSSIPDVFSGVALASLLDEYLFVHKPLTIGGSSKHSNGRAHIDISKRPDHAKEDSPALQFLREGKSIPVHERIPTLENGSIPPIGLVFCLESYLQCERLHKNKDLPSMQRFLSQVIAAAPKGISISQWAAEFASRNSISLPKGREAARRIKMMKRVASLPRSGHSALFTMRVGSKSDPILNVYDASLRAEQLVRSPISSLRTLASTIMRAHLRIRANRKK